MINQAAEGKNMRKSSLALSLLAALSGAMLSTQLHAQTLPASGTVTKINEAAGKITLKHGPIKKLDMDEGMTMVFKAGTPEMLKQVKAGDKVRFDADRVNGQLTVTKIEKAK
jgi:Cu/Ag efflux protein CusF